MLTVRVTIICQGGEGVDAMRSHRVFLSNDSFLFLYVYEGRGKFVLRALFSVNGENDSLLFF